MPIFEILVIIILILINGLFAMSELAVVSARRPRLKTMAARGVKGAKRAMALAADPGRLLSAAQTGITLVSILAGAYSGASLGDQLSVWLQGLGMSKAWAEPLGLGVVVAVITYFSLIIGELVPKQLALRNAERIACMVAPFMTILARVAAPIVWFVDASGRFVLFLLQRKASGESKVTEEEDGGPQAQTFGHSWPQAPHTLEAAVSGPAAMRPLQQPEASASGVRQLRLLRRRRDRHAARKVSSSDRSIP